MLHNRWFYRLALVAFVLTIGVVVLGAYVRLSDAGLGCPDWPGCYGHLGVPKSEHQISRANELFPERPVERDKAWKEMVHRYFAGILGLLVFSLAVVAWRNRSRPEQPVRLPLFLVVLIIFQALLGMWTVTVMLKPVIVMLHLLGGFATLSLLWWLVLRQSRWPHSVAAGMRNTDKYRKWMLAGLLVVVLQIMLGGWTSANYAALHCPDFPTCQNQWLPPMDFREGFTLWHGVGQDFEGGILDNDARVAIHFTHRIGALLTLLFVGALGIWLLSGKLGRTLRLSGAAVLAVLALQISLGIGNVLLSLPLGLAVAHNAIGAALLLALVTINYLFYRRKYL